MIVSLERIRILLKGESGARIVNDRDTVTVTVASPRVARVSHVLDHDVLIEVPFIVKPMGSWLSPRRKKVSVFDDGN